MLLTGQRQTQSKNINIRGPFKALDRVETVLDTCEAALGERIRSAEDITSIPNPDKVVLLIQFESGLRIKVCISAPDNRCFEMSSRLIDAVGSANFPRVLIQGDGWAAFEWIEGKTISQQGFSQDIVHQAACLLTAIHSAKIEPVAGTPETILNEVRLKLKEKLPVLVSNEVISDAQSQKVTELCNSLSADSLNISLIHGDFSPANLVVRGRELYSVDNEKMRVHVTDYDVCRAVTFWDERNLSGVRLLDTYSKQSGRRFARQSLFFWGVFDLVYRISYRVSSFGEVNKFYVMRLRQILRTGTFR